MTEYHFRIVFRVSTREKNNPYKRTHNAPIIQFLLNVLKTGVFSVTASMKNLSGFLFPFLTVTRMLTFCKQNSF